jgi:hypothetical protein
MLLHLMAPDNISRMKMDGRDRLSTKRGHGFESPESLAPSSTLNFLVGPPSIKNFNLVQLSYPI